MCYYLIQKMNIQIHTLIKSEACYTSNNQQPRKIPYTSEMDESRCHTAPPRQRGGDGAPRDFAVHPLLTILYFLK